MMRKEIPKPQGKRLGGSIPGCKIWVSLFPPIERDSDARLGGVHFYGPPRFGPLGIFFGFFLLNLGHAAPNYSRKPPMRSSKAPPKQKKWGKFYPTLANPSRTWPPSHARWGYLDISVKFPLSTWQKTCEVVNCLLWWDVVSKRKEKKAKNTLY